jgi:superfamily II DNA or RNA helicase
VHPALSPGDLLLVRGHTWILQSIASHADCRELELEPADWERRRDACPASRLVLLTPFDRPVKLSAAASARAVSRRAWIAALRRAILRQREPLGLVSPVRAAIDLLPHQLEPAMAVVHRGATRLLLADEVGLGKTIEAGLVLAELHARGELGHGLVLAPPGLRDQWAAELSGRFGLEAAVADAAWLRTCRAALPASVNPWSVPGIFITSYDFAKRPEVLRSLEEVLWDAVVQDEAHLAAGDSERRAAADAIASRARVVLLLTATPHSGDPRGFDALCRLGSLGPDDPIVIFRRDRARAGLERRRRVSLHRVRGGSAERLVRRHLDDYIRRVWTRKSEPGWRDAQLAMMVLLKRSFSGMAPLRRSLEARLARLNEGDAPAPLPTQLSLGLDDDLDAADEAPADVLGAPGLINPAEERAVVASLVELAGAAEALDSKQRALLRLLRWTREPVIVFTEYRDTLSSLQQAIGDEAGVLHGGLDRAARAAVLWRFTSGGLRVLLATDAAGEGLNLQHCCRLVVNLELPWNPMRLEQRIGRVDRIGQAREVRAVNLVAGATAESDLLARLVRRLDRARAAIGPLRDVLGGHDEEVVACQLGIEPPAAAIEPLSDPPARTPATVAGCSFDMAGDAAALAEHLHLLRRLSRASRQDGRRVQRNVKRRTRAGVLVTAVRRTRMPAAFRHTGVLAVVRVRHAEQVRRNRSHELVPVFVASPCPRILRAREARDRANAFITEHATALAGALRSPPLPPPQAGSPDFDRDARLATRAPQPRALQRGLFDTRAEREAGARAGRDSGPAAEAQGPGGQEAQSGAVVPDACDLAVELLLFITS